MLALVVGGLLVPVLGWLVGVFLVLTSRLWTTREKLLATLVVPGGASTFFYLGSLPASSCSTSSRIGPDGQVTVYEDTCTGASLPQPLAVLAMAVLVVAPLVVGVLLLRRARRRASGLVQPDLTWRGQSRRTRYGLTVLVALVVAAVLVPLLAGVTSPAEAPGVTYTVPEPSPSPSA